MNQELNKETIMEDIRMMQEALLQVNEILKVMYAKLTQIRMEVEDEEHTRKSQ